MSISIKGIGLVTALGDGKEENTSALKLGESAIEKNAGYEFPVALIPIDNLAETEPKAARLMGMALKQAMEEAGPWERDERVGIIVGTTTAGMDVAERYIKKYVSGQHEHLNHARFLTPYLLGYCTHLLSKEMGDNISVMTVSTACSSSANAISLAMDALMADDLDLVFAVGAEALTELTVNGFASLQLLSGQRSVPFSKSAKGINLGEAAAAIALRKGRGGYGNILGVGHSSDAYHLTAPLPDGKEFVAAMAKACEEAGVRKSDIDYVNAHGTGTALNDSAETRAFKTFFGEDRWPVITSTKSLTGHCLGAAGLVELSFTALGLHHRFFPMGAPVSEPIDPLVREPGNGEVMRIALSNSFGFGGNNTSILISSGDYE
ncbi:3-oxoacyl-[acyl-carrier-protein] synthase, KASII [hydrothermal vent metagenome]|uniref:3-oxoacyl-[acyl-carrier-protein] synthase, KASII n=1 Tax=hydrothermal vent metagenome TaxID=652676 RepID=A0A3B1CFF0_9ZZZZ